MNYPPLIGIPMEGESLGEDEFDGNTEFALFPGDLPKNPESVFKQVESVSHPTYTPKADSTHEIKSAPLESKSKGAELFDDPLCFVRFRPPELDKDAQGVARSLPQYPIGQGPRISAGRHPEMTKEHDTDNQQGNARKRTPRAIKLDRGAYGDDIARPAADTGATLSLSNDFTPDSEDYTGQDQH